MLPDAIISITIPATYMMIYRDGLARNKFIYNLTTVLLLPYP